MEGFEDKYRRWMVSHDGNQGLPSFLGFHFGLCVLIFIYGTWINFSFNQFPLSFEQFVYMLV
jgi:hypothetical protein